MSAPNNNNRITELMVAASRGDLSRAEALLRDEWTALMIAALNNRPPVVAALLRRGAYPDAQNATGWTALMIAERKGHEEVARLLRTGRVEKPLPALIKQPAADRPRGPEVDLADFPDHIED